MVTIIPNDKFIFGCDFSEFKFKLRVFLYPSAWSTRRAKVKNHAHQPLILNSHETYPRWALSLNDRLYIYVYIYMYIHSSSLLFSDKVPYNILHRFTDYRIYNRV